MGDGDAVHHDTVKGRQGAVGKDVLTKVTSLGLGQGHDFNSRRGEVLADDVFGLGDGNEILHGVSFCKKRSNHDWSFLSIHASLCV